MNTPTPTSNAAAALDAAPPGFPDLATLNRLAGEFFAAAASGREPHAGPAPHSPQDVLTVATRLPSLAPAAQAPNGVPDSALEALPALGRGGTHALSVPEAYSPPAPLPANPQPAYSQPPSPPAPPLPVGAPAAGFPGGSSPGSPFYFLGEGNGYPSAAPSAVTPTLAHAASTSEPSYGTVPSLSGIPPRTGGSPGSAGSAAGRGAGVRDRGAPEHLPPQQPNPAPATAPGPDRTGISLLTLPGNATPPTPPATPQPTGAPTPAGIPAGPSSPYYFLGESSAYHGAVPSASAPEASYTGLPSDNDLKALLSGADRTPASPQAARPANTDSPYYFVNPPAATPQAQPYATREQTPQVPQSAHPPFDVQAIRRDFPILQERVNGKPLIWMDNAATTHKPQAVIDRLAYFYAHENSNIHRAAHELAARATDAYEGARNKVARFLGASSAEEIIFVRGATEAINLVAKTWGVQNVGAGDEIIVSHLEHHANIVPWQQLAAQKGAKLRVIPVYDDGQILLDEYRKLLNDRTKIVAVTQVSNALGTITPIKDIIDIGHRAGARVLVDGAQAVSHLRVNVQALDADFYVFSGHKIFGPTGIGVVYGKKEILEDMPPWQGGGNMIVDVTFERTIFQPPPGRFEAGTGNIADAVGLGAALDYVDRIGLENISRYEHDLVAYATHGLLTVPGIRLIGTAKEKASVISFVLNGHRNEDIGAALNREGIAVRTGHHCAQPILRRLGVETAVRPSLAFYNTCEEVDKLVSVVNRLARKGVV